MAILNRLRASRSLHRTIEVVESSYLLGSSRSYSTGFPIGNRCLAPQFSSYSISSCLYKKDYALPRTSGSMLTLRSTMAAELLSSSNGKNLSTAGAQPQPQTSTPQTPPPAQRKMVATQMTIVSPGFIYEPYAPREPISFWKRYFTRAGWKRTKEDIILELRSAYAINKLRKSGYSKKKFYTEAVKLYKEINTMIANGDKTAVRKAVTEHMFSEIKNEIRIRENMWNKIYWELLEPVVKLRTLQARLIAVDRNDMNKVFVQLTMEFLSKQKFEAYDSKGAVVAGDKSKEVLVKEIWVFEKSLFHANAFWRLCGRIKTT